MKHNEGKFKGQNNLNLYYQCWKPEDSPKAVLLVAHGLAEHSGRYKNLVDYFVPKGYAIWAIDHRGHGKSEGIRSYVDRFDEYLTDLGNFLSIARKEHRGDKIFLLGHSMGGTIATAYMIEHPKDFDGGILSGASLTQTAAVSPVLLAMAGIISALMPKMGVTILDATALSKDQAVVDAYVNDPLVFRGKIPARMGAELVRMWKTLPEQMPKLNLPLLILHGTDDKLSNPEGSKILYRKASSKDKTLKLYEGLYHEIFNEPEHKKVMTDIETWLNNHL